MSTASELSRRLAAQAEAVCRAYLPNGRRHGRYWIAGDVTGARAAACSSNSGATGPAAGPMPRPASMAICSTSSGSTKT